MRLVKMILIEPANDLNTPSCLEKYANQIYPNSRNNYKNWMGKFKINLNPADKTQSHAQNRKVKTTHFHGWVHKTNNPEMLIKKLQTVDIIMEAGYKLKLYICCIKN